MVSHQHLGIFCPFSGSCPIYRGEEKVENTPDYLLKNIFCNGGRKCWKNCKQYRLLKGDEDFLSSKYSN